MLSKLRCPHTGLVNFFTDVDPFMSVGSIIATAPSRYVWRCHLVDHCCGVTTDPLSAEANLRRCPGGARRLSEPHVCAARIHSRGTSQVPLRNSTCRRARA